MNQTAISPKDVKRVLATAKVATHCKPANTTVWNKIVSVDEEDYFIYLADPLDRSNQITSSIEVRLLYGPDQLVFANIQEVELVTPDTKPGEVLLFQLHEIKRDMSAIITNVTRFDKVKRKDYHECIDRLYYALMSTVKVGVFEKETYSWFRSQRCSFTTASLAVLLYKETNTHRNTLYNKNVSNYSLQEGFSNWGRWFKLIDLIMEDLKKAFPLTQL
jgi:hypothetical protein